MEFTKEKTNIAKGIAICLMFAFHLYTFEERLINGNTFIPTIPFFNAEHYLGNFGNICVSIFLFLSGYGMYLGSQKSPNNVFNYAIAKLKDLYINYWLYLLIFVPFGLFVIEDLSALDPIGIYYSTKSTIVFNNLLGFNTTYNLDWWFVSMFAIIIVFLFPLYTIIIQRNSIALIILSLTLYYFNRDVGQYGLMAFVVRQTSFALGMLCAKHNFFSSKIIKKLEDLSWIWIVLALTGIFIIKFIVNFVPDYDFALTPLFIYFSIRLVETNYLSKVFAYLGKYSFQMWLVHSFFAIYYLQDLTFLPKWSPLIFALLVAKTLLSVLLIEYLCSQINKRFKSFTKNNFTTIN